jgi:hypothetical protein
VAVREKREVAHLMSYSRYSAFVAMAITLCLLPPAVVAQEGERMDPSITVRPKPTGVTPRTRDGHPDFTGVWNGMRDNLGGVPNQLHNAGIAVENDNSTHDVLSGASIATWPVTKRKPQNSEQGERAATLFRRMGANRPIFPAWEVRLILASSPTI